MAALSLIGTPYRWGGDDPERGLDCSGLVSHVFRQVTGRALPHNASRIAALARDVPRAELAPGDLVFFDTLGAPYSHMGIYLGENRFLHAPSRGGQVRADKLTDRYYASRLTATKTLFGA